MFARRAKPKLLQEYVEAGKARYIFKHFPFLGDESFYAAEAAECAGEQGKFWEFHDLLFSLWQGEGVGTFLPEKLVTYAQESGLDTASFRQCLESHRYEAAVLADKKSGQKMGVKATPTIFINGEHKGAPRDYAELKAWIEAALTAQ